MSEKLRNLEGDVEIDDNSIENDFYFSYLTIESDDGDYHRLRTLEAPNLENIEFEQDFSVELYETVPLPTLQQLSAIVIAIESWYRIITHEDANRLGAWFQLLSEGYIDEEYLLQHLPLPGVLRELVKKYLDRIRVEMYAWIQFNECKITRYHDMFFVSASDLIFCIWTSEGKIDYRKTASNMLKNRKMNILYRFRIMSEFCFEDEIKRLQPNSIPERFRKRITFDDTPVQYYWLCYINDDFEKLRKRSTQSMEAFMITKELDTWSAIEYFWDRLNINEQISAALVLLKDFRVSNIQRQLFSKMNQFQKHHVLSTIPSVIIGNFFYEKKYELAYLTLIMVGNKLTYENFTDLISNLLRWCLPNRGEGLHSLGKLWNLFPDDYKNRALQSMTGNIICEHTQYFWPQDGDPKTFNATFLLAFLSSGSADFRRNFMSNHGSSIALSCDSSMIDQVIKLCLPTSNDLSLFRKSLFRDHLVLSCHVVNLNCVDGDLKQLADFIHRFFPNPDSKIKFIEKLVVSSQSWFHFNFQDPMILWASAVELIEKYFDAYPPHEIMKYKRRIVWASVKCHVRLKYDYKNFHLFIQVITRVLEGDLLERYKKVALNKFHRRCWWFKFDKIGVHQFLLWCLNYDYVEMKKFIKSLPIDNIFWQAWNDVKSNSFFNQKQSRQLVFEMLAPIDKMLLWYFEKSDQVKKFKLEKVFDFRNSKSTIFVTNIIYYSDEIFTENVLPWFFEGDREEISRFKEMFRDDDISKMIQEDVQY